MKAKDVKTGDDLRRFCNERGLSQARLAGIIDYCNANYICSLMQKGPGSIPKQFVEALKRNEAELNSKQK